MRPAGEVRQALWSACNQLVTPDRGPTLREMAMRACVGFDAARSTVRDMARAGQIRQVRERRVGYRNRPVAEYAPTVPVPVVVPSDEVSFADLSSVLRAWVG